MPDISLVADTGRTKGSRPSRRLRAQGRIPGVVYGQGMEPVPVSVDQRALRAALSSPAGMNAVITLEVGGASYPTIVKDVHRHPVRRSALHVDFLRINLDEDIEVPVPVVLTGEARAVLSEGGLLEIAADSVTVRARPRDLPAELSLDVSELTIGDVLRVENLSAPPGAEIVDDPETVLVIAQGQQAAEVPEVAEAGEEGAEGEAVEGEAEGAAGSES